jgi:hypothetical protein
VGSAALVVPALAAERRFHRLRARLDRSAGEGMPAHITLLYPFLPPSSIDEAVIAKLEALFAGTGLIEYRFSRVGWFGDKVLFLEPEPAQPFRCLTERLGEAFPDCPPYGGAFADIIPHMTVGIGAARWRMRRVARRLSRLLPVADVATEVWLMATHPRTARWEQLRAFHLR